jgi:hypothetical protein
LALLRRRSAAAFRNVARPHVERHRATPGGVSPSPNTPHPSGDRDPGPFGRQGLLLWQTQAPVQGSHPFRPGGYSISNDSARYQSPPRFRSVAALEVDGWGLLPHPDTLQTSTDMRGSSRRTGTHQRCSGLDPAPEPTPARRGPRVSRRATVRRCTGCHPCTGYRGKARPGHPQDDFLGATGPRAGRQEERPGGLLTPRIWHADRGDCSTLAEGWNRD